MRAPLKAAIVGFGYMGEIRQRTIAAQPTMRLVAICDPRLTSSPVAGVPLMADWTQLLDSGLGLDIVFVCTPHTISPDVAIAALDRGLHVFCEKPPGRNAADVRRIIAAEQRARGRKLMFGFNHRHHPGITDAKAIIDSGALGAVLTLRGMYGKSGGTGFEDSWRNHPDSGGGILLDQGIHMLDLFRLFCGDFQEVVGMTARAHWNIPGEDNAFVLLRNTHGQIAQLHSSATSWKHMFRLEIGLERGYLTINGLLSKTGSYGRETLLISRRPRSGEAVALGNPREELTYYDVDPSWDVQVEQFVEAILTDGPVADSTSHDALRVMEIIEAVYATSASGPVRSSSV
ncbi:MAG: oxidoreductase [Acidimicrobiia bacterium]